MRVCVIGTGYVGLVTGACLAHIGHQVICVDNNQEKVKLMKAGRSPIFEPGLSEIMQSAIESGNIEFTTDLGAGVAHGEILFIAVGTPPLPTGESDTRYVEAVARGIGTHLNGGYKVIVNKSTVPIGSGDWVRMIVVDGVAERQKVLVTLVVLVAVRRFWKSYLRLMLSVIPSSCAKAQRCMTLLTQIELCWEAIIPKRSP